MSIKTKTVNVHGHKHKVYENVGKSGKSHGSFRSKSAAAAQTRAMYEHGYKGPK